MINWQTISDLHVINKLQEIIGNWFKMELFYSDAFGKIQNGVLEKNYEAKSMFFKTQLSMPHGHQFLLGDLEKVSERLGSEQKNTYRFETFFEGVFGVASEIEADGEVIGVVYAYPFVKDTFTQKDENKLIAQLQEHGASKEDAQQAVKQLHKISSHDQEYLEELIGLVAEEVMTFNEEIAKREQRIQMLNSEVGSKYRYHSMIGKSKKMQQIYHLLEKVSSSDSTILIQGENGTGKELVAKAIHYNSPRRNAVFLAQNCSAFNDNLLDSELFGHVRGAFTGAVKDKKGLFEMANGGTLFLDEIGDTSLTMQVKLLRVLQEGTFLPVGATQPRRVNVRVLAATNKPIKDMIKTGEFREDLYYRINVINLVLPPLRERREDIPLLIDHFLEKRCAETGLATKTFSKKAMEKILDYEWAGNVRELENEIERLVVLSGDDKVITPDLLSSRITEFGDTTPSSLQGVNTNGSLKDALEELETFMIREGLRRCKFNKSRLAKELGISRAGLIMKVEKYGLDKRKKNA